MERKSYATSIGGGALNEKITTESSSEVPFVFNWALGCGCIENCRIGIRFLLVIVIILYPLSPQPASALSDKTRNTMHRPRRRDLVARRFFSLRFLLSSLCPAPFAPHFLFVNSSSSSSSLINVQIIFSHPVPCPCLFYETNEYIYSRNISIGGKEFSTLKSVGN